MQGIHGPRPLGGEQNPDGHLRQKHRPPFVIGENPVPTGQALRCCGKQEGVIGGALQGIHGPRPLGGEQNPDGHLRQKHRPPFVIGENPIPTGQALRCSGKQEGVIGSALQGTHGPRPSGGEQSPGGHMLQSHGVPGFICEYPIPCGQS